MLALYIYKVLQFRYPQADFKTYFAFLEACRHSPQNGEIHTHHICPVSKFPDLEDDDNNKIQLTTDNHSKAHQLLAKACPALRVNKNFIVSAARGGRLAGMKNKENRTGICKLTKEQLQAQYRKWQELKIGVCAPGVAEAAGHKGGLISGPIVAAMSYKWSLTRQPLPIETILAKYQQGSSIAAIALSLGCPAGRGMNRIRRVLIQHGVLVDKHLPTEEILLQYRHGANVSAIAKALKLSCSHGAAKSRVRRLLKKHGIYTGKNYLLATAAA